MKDPQESRKITADVLFIQSELLDGFGGGFKQGGVRRSLVFTDKAAKLFWDGKGHHEMVAGKLMLQPFVQPLLDFMILTSRAMAIAAGAMNQMGLAAFFTLV